VLRDIVEGVDWCSSRHVHFAGSHDAYLCLDARDPRKELATTLLNSLGTKGRICTYTGYERGVLSGLAEALPDQRSALLAVVDRLWDLHPIIKAHDYHPASNGSYSIKAVLHAVVPHLAHDDLEIQEGTMASVQFFRMAFGTGDLAEKACLRTALLEYCERDTLPKVELRRALRTTANTQHGLCVLTDSKPAWSAWCFESASQRIRYSSPLSGIAKKDTMPKSELSEI